MERWRARSLLPRSVASREGDPPQEFPTFPDYWRRRLGRKVSLRFKVHDDPAHPHSEAIGMVSSVEDDGPSALVTVVNRRGVATTFDCADVEAAKDFS